MIDFEEILHHGDGWEQFTRDFLEELGFYVESPPDRGPDGGKDMLVTEEVAGKLHRYRFRWLVSCKHFALSGSAVNESDHERNILERVAGFVADGFMGFYSTLPSSGLNNRLKQLKETGRLREYKIFDGRTIEHQLLTKGFAHLSARYFPISHKAVRPIHNVIDEYVDLKCDNCGKDLLLALYDPEKNAVIAEVKEYTVEGNVRIHDVYFACKGECDKTLERAAYEKYGEVSGWKDLSDLAMPNDYLRWILATINQLSGGRHFYLNDSLKKEKQLIMALAQKVFREVSEKERARLRDLMRYEF